MEFRFKIIYQLKKISDFMQFFGVVFLVTTTLILLCKKEKPLETQRSFEDSLTVKETYNIVFNLFKLTSIRKLVLILLTCKVNESFNWERIILKIFNNQTYFSLKIAFGLHTVAYLKLIEKGVPKEKLGLLALPLTPFEVVLPLLISRYTNGPNPLRIFTNAYPFRLENNFSK